MARLPQPGRDMGAWGDILNEFLLQEHNSDGTLKLRTSGDLDKEPIIESGSVSQYWRGDKTWQALDKTVVGLSAVNNTSDDDKPVSSATQTALNEKVNTNGSAISGDLTFASDVGLTFNGSNQYLKWATGEGLWLAVADDNKNLKFSYGGGSGRLVIDQYGYGEVARFSNGALSMRSHYIKDVADPYDASDAATKNYVDTKGWSDAPATTSSAGIAGQKAYDNQYMYVCVSTDTWRRVALEAW